jgi:hypothetical protein
MRGVAALVGLLVALAAGYAVYQKALPQGSLAQAPPQEQIDVVGVRADLLSIGQAERQYLLSHGTYGTLDALVQDGLLTGGVTRPGYSFSVVLEGSRAFTATAAPSDPARLAVPRSSSTGRRRSQH